MDSLADTENSAPLTEGLETLRISEIVLKTSRFEAVRNWYVDALGVKPFYENKPEIVGGKDGEFLRASDVRLCFIRIHMDYPYTQILGIFEVPALERNEPQDPGLHHMQFRHSSLSALIDRYDRFTEAGWEPHRTANHGPSTSFYYHDPDGNNVEFSGPNYETEEEYLGYMSSEAFRNNPSGIEIDVEEYVTRFKSGVPQSELVRIG